jgi:hypothetical protein
MIAMETKTGKVLDEACNCNNDVYGDEVLYATWAATPRAARAANDPKLVLSPAERLRALADAFMARLYACQE